MKLFGKKIDIWLKLRLSFIETEITLSLFQMYSGQASFFLYIPVSSLLNVLITGTKKNKISAYFHWVVPFKKIKLVLWGHVAVQNSDTTQEVNCHSYRQDQQTELVAVW